MPDDPEQRLVRIEASLAHLEHQVEQLNQVLIEQGKVLGRVRKQVQTNTNALRALDLERMKSHNPKPPHYQ